MTFNDDESIYLIDRVLGILDPESVASDKDADRNIAMHADDDAED